MGARLRWLAGLVSAYCVTATNCSADEKPFQVLPLESVWALDMPDTRDIFGIDLGRENNDEHFVGWGYSEYRRLREKSIKEAARALRAKWPEDLAQRGFVLPRRADVLTLRATSDWLALKHLWQQSRNPCDRDGVPVRPQTITSQEDLTLVFFSHALSYYVRLSEIRLGDSWIDVRYRVVPHGTPETTVHFALIPIGKLPAGEYQVGYNCEQLDAKFFADGFLPLGRGRANRSVCSGFRFEVNEPEVASTK